MHRRSALTLLATAALALSLAGCADGTSTGTDTGEAQGVPTLDSGVAGELDQALAAVRRLPGVRSASTWIELHESFTDAAGHDVTPPGLDLWNDARLNGGAPEPTQPAAPGAQDDPVVPRATPTARPTPPPGSTEHHSFTALVTVTMASGATAAQAGTVPTTMAGRIAWTGVSLDLTLPAGTNGVAPIVTYSGTFDQTIPIATSTDIAAGAMTIGAAPGVTWLAVSIPPTMRVDYGQLDVEAGPGADGDAIRAVVAGTVFRDTTTHGALPNGAKP